MVGAGAVGNEVIKNLALLGVGELAIFDLDVIEEHNLTRSVLFRATDIGRPKAAVAAERARALDNNIAVTGIHGDFWDHLRLLELRNHDLLFCCVDNFEARIRCNTLCHFAKVDFINIGIDSRFASVEIFPFSHSLSGCFECNLPDGVYSRIGERYSCGHLRKLSFIEKKIPTTIITSAAAASLAVSAGLRLGANDNKPTAQRLYLDTIAGGLTRTGLAVKEGCPCCGRYAEEPRLVPSGRKIGALPQDLYGTATVTLSEPVLVGYSVGGVETIVLERASDFDTDFPTKVSDDPGAVLLEVKDQFSLAEIAARFPGRNIPCKFAVVADEGKPFLFEFTGTAS